MMATDGGGEFTPCAIDGHHGFASGGPLPQWERNLVLMALAVHVTTVVLDVCVVLVFAVSQQWGFCIGSAAVIGWAWLVSSCYVSFGAAAVGSGGGGGGDIDGEVGGRPGGFWTFFLNLFQVQIFIEAFRCVKHSPSSGDYFHTLRLMESILESAPQSLLKLYALLLFSKTFWALEGSVLLFQASAFFSVLSVSLGLAMWEQKVQFSASPTYVVIVAFLRALEITSRSLTLALFAYLTHPYGFWWALLGDYALMLMLIAKHKSVQFTYGFFVAFPLVLVSLEPLVWRREDHAVPKDAYYAVRVVEFMLMWAMIVFSQDDRRG